jgi:hypothetical protein
MNTANGSQRIPLNFAVTGEFDVAQVGNTFHFIQNDGDSIELQTFTISGTTVSLQLPTNIDPFNCLIFDPPVIITTEDIAISSDGLEVVIDTNLITMIDQVPVTTYQAWIVSLETLLQGSFKAFASIPHSGSALTDDPPCAQPITWSQTTALGGISIGAIEALETADELTQTAQAAMTQTQSVIILQTGEAMALTGTYQTGLLHTAQAQATLTAQVTLWSTGLLVYPQFSRVTVAQAAIETGAAYAMLECSRCRL